MSSEYMRKIMESIDVANQVTEGYDDRVQAVADVITKNNPDGITRKAFARELDRAGQQANAVELRGSPQARRDFEKDVAARLEFRRDNSAQDSKKTRVEEALRRLSTIIEEAVGNAYPDGDPFDEIAPKARRLGIPLDSLSDWLDRATKKHLGFSRYYAYLAAVWDDYMDTTGDRDSGRKNPWR